MLRCDRTPHLVSRAAWWAETNRMVSQLGHQHTLSGIVSHQRVPIPQLEARKSGIPSTPLRSVVFGTPHGVMVPVVSEVFAFQFFGYITDRHLSGKHPLSEHTAFPIDGMHRHVLCLVDFASIAAHHGHCCSDSIANSSRRNSGFRTVGVKQLPEPVQNHPF